MKQVMRLKMPRHFHPMGFSVCKKTVILFSPLSFCTFTGNGRMVGQTLFHEEIQSAVFLPDEDRGLVIGQKETGKLYEIDLRGIVKGVYQIPETYRPHLCSDPFGKVFLCAEGDCRRLLFSDDTIHLIPSSFYPVPCAAKEWCAVSYKNRRIYLSTMSLDKGECVISKEPIYFLSKCP